MHQSPAEFGKISIERDEEDDDDEDEDEVIAQGLANESTTVTAVRSAMAIRTTPMGMMMVTEGFDAGVEGSELDCDAAAVASVYRAAILVAVRLGSGGFKALETDRAEQLQRLG